MQELEIARKENKSHEHQKKKKKKKIIFGTLL
jgi:hypothetical protein